VPSAAKVMVTVFWDAEGLILAEFLERGQTITAALYVQTEVIIMCRNHYKAKKSYNIWLKFTVE